MLNGADSGGEIDPSRYLIGERPVAEEDRWSLQTQENSNILQVFESVDGEESKDALYQIEDVSSYRRNEDGSIFATVAGNGTMQLRDTATGNSIGAPIQTNWPDILLAFTYDDKWLIAEDRAESTVRIWDTATGKPSGAAVKLDSHQVGFHVAEHALPLLVLTDGVDGRFFDITMQSFMGNPFSYQGSNRATRTLSPDWKYLAVLDGEQTVQIRNVRTREPFGLHHRTRSPGSPSLALPVGI